MSELKNTIVSDMTAAMKARDKETVAALRMLKAAIQTEEVSGSKHELTDDEVLRVIEREVKKRRESAEMYAENGRQELANAELAEAEVFARYQPEQLDDDAVKNLVAESVAEVAGDDAPSMKIMGQVMKVAKEKAAGQVDGKRLSEAVKAALQG
ncbi:glutamyl-tRNA amidotransferase [Corynebacterium sp. LK22]|uniref:GatB/YqeY domain-containing protein n=1 Tax=Corynebacterium TaxID=1716 RepID=UPI0008A16C97|nr:MULTISPECIES: GatB/YqeY domain-containing protein [unclassified Corynebacterium]AYX80938.1 GatB/YqeY domain-containing protein [Corynebacterium jeikeium]MBC6764799.1 glutamyl-tRNA amidotransferase [Corynebacterium sp. LK22]MBS5168044.1 GatB/YqeY domain-containing protein [Corynebacterium sp.]OFO24505.1 glutamyl-tRNA amidotransferase [Corynebacterium sp. HMSC064E07]